MRIIFSGSAFYFIFSCCLFFACTKAVNDPTGSADGEVYTVSNMDFFLAEDDTIDSVFSQLDTIIVVNASADPLPDTTIYPYQSLKDSVYVALIGPSPDTLTLADSIRFRHMIVRPNGEGELVLGNLPQDSVSIAGFPVAIDMPLMNVNIAETFEPAPKTRYEITGEYWRVRYSVSFRAYAVRPSDGHTLVLQGKVHYSTVSVSSYDGQEPRPNAVITIISEVE